MGLFFKKKSGGIDVLSPIKGKIVPIEKLKDKTFAGKVMGDGVAIIPSDGKVYSPVAGTISALMDTKHAYGITSKDGFDVLVHIGQDTVNLKGEGFTTSVKENQKVKPGTLLGTFDMEVLKKKGYNLATPVILITGDYKITSKTDAKEVNVGDVLFSVAK